MKSTELLNLAEHIRLAIQKDWEMQLASGERTETWKQAKFDRGIYKRIPSVGTSQTLKNIYGYYKYNQDTGTQTRELSEVRVKQIIEHLYRNMITPTGWPSVNKTIKNFMGGKFWYLIKPYLSDVKVDRIKEAVLNYGDASPLSGQLMQLALRIRDEEAKFNQAKGESRDVKQENKKLRLKLESLRMTALSLYDELKEKDPEAANKLFSKVERLLN